MYVNRNLTSSVNFRERYATLVVDGGSLTCPVTMLPVSMKPYQVEKRDPWLNGAMFLSRDHMYQPLNRTLNYNPRTEPEIHTVTRPRIRNFDRKTITMLEPLREQMEIT
jgi:hypothetical protein